MKVKVKCSNCESLNLKNFGDIISKREKFECVNCKKLLTFKSESFSNFSPLDLLSICLLLIITTFLYFKMGWGGGFLFFVLLGGWIHLLATIRGVYSPD